MDLKGLGNESSRLQQQQLDFHEAPTLTTSLKQYLIQLNRMHLISSQDACGKIKRFAIYAESQPKHLLKLYLMSKISKHRPKHPLKLNLMSKISKHRTNHPLKLYLMSKIS